MSKAKGKTVSFDTMIRLFIRQYNLPTRRDIDKLANRIERLEKAVNALKRQVRGGVAPVSKQGASRPRAKTDPGDSERVMEMIRNQPRGVGFPQMREQTGFEDKKIRNIVFRLKKLGKIERVRRGVYKAA